MKQFLTKLLLFVPFVVVFYIGMVILWGETAPEPLKKNLIYNRGTFGHTFSRLEEAKYTKDVDVLFLGSSTTYRGFDTEFFHDKGLKAFNLGSSSQTPTQTHLLLKKYLDKLRPKLVVYEVYPETFQIDGIEASLDILANDHIDRETVWTMLKTGNVRTLNAVIYGSYREWTGKNDGFREPVDREDDHYVSGGFVRRDLKYFKHETVKKQQWKMLDKQKAEFETILALLKKRHIPVLLVRAPITKGLNDSYTNNRMIGNYMRSKGDYTDFNGKLPLDDSLHFYDATHLNQDGVRIFDEAVFKLITGSGEHRLMKGDRQIGTFSLPE
jgi:hypothetical protein